MFSRRTAFSVLAAPLLSSCEPQMQSVDCIDFVKAKMDWILKNGTRGSWQIVAAAYPINAKTDAQNAFYLAPVVMAGHLFGPNQLPITPAYSFQLIASRHKHIIFRNGEAQTNIDSVSDNGTEFASFAHRIPVHSCRLLELGSILPDHLTELWPLQAQVHLLGRDGLSWILQFPVQHISHLGDGKGSKFQVETGPILVPQTCVSEEIARPTGGFFLAYAFFNKNTELQLLIFGSSEASAVRQYDRPARLADVSVHVFSALS